MYAEKRKHNNRKYFLVLCIALAVLFLCGSHLLGVVGEHVGAAGDAEGAAHYAQYETTLGQENAMESETDSRRLATVFVIIGVLAMSYTFFIRLSEGELLFHSINPIQSRVKLVI